MIPLEDICNAYPIPSAWTDEGFTPSRNWNITSSPFRKDENPSFSIYADGRKWKDHGTGEGGNVFDFICRSRGCEFKDALSIILNRLGWENTTTHNRKDTPSRKVLRLPDMHRGEKDELRSLASLRNLSIESLKLATDQGWLWFAELLDDGEHHKAWLLTDASRRTAQARKLNTKGWTHLPGNPKAKTLAGSEASWPIGAADLKNKPNVAFCEGMPDFLTAIHFARNEGKEMHVAPVCMLGASLNIHEEALGFFKGKTIKIFPHLDDAGITAANRWAKQLYAAGACEVIAFKFKGLTKSDGLPVCDLNHLAYQGENCWQTNFHSRELFNFN